MKKIVLICVIFLASVSSGFAVDSRVDSAYNGFLTKIQNRSLSDQKQVLEGLQNTLNSFKYEKKYSSIVPIIEDLEFLNNQALYDIWQKKRLSQSSQKIIELQERKNFSVSKSVPDISNNAASLISSSREFLETNNQREFIDSGNIFRIQYTKYFPINSTTLTALEQKKGIIIFDEDSGEYRFIEEYSFEKKIPYSQLSDSFDIFIDASHKIHKKGDQYYGYNFQNFRLYEDNYGVYQSQLDSSGFDKKTTLLYLNELGEYTFVTDYQVHNIAEGSNILGLPDMHLFLDSLGDDAKYKTPNMSTYLKEIQSISQSLTDGKTQQQKIEVIYKWILENIEYSSNIDLNDQKIFSAIESYKNKQGVCTGYTKLMQYMLSYAGIYDVEVIRGFVIDAEDFPQIGHAWLRIGDRYYDPTFDDPIGAQSTKTPEQYKYFGLPKDIFYANRFEYGDMPEMFKTATKSQIDQHIFNTLSNLIPKYQNNLSDYPVFAKISFKNKYNISASTSITPDLLSSKISSYQVLNDSFKFQKSGETQLIRQIRYYNINDNNTESVLDILGYDTDKLTLFNWQTASGTQEWRLAYELELQ